MLQRPGSSWGFGALLKDTSVVVLKEDTPPPTIPAGPEIRTHNLPLTSPTRYLLGHDCPKHNTYYQCTYLYIVNAVIFKLLLTSYLKRDLAKKNKKKTITLPL